MRPDKKGNKRRDERRNGTKVGSQKSSGSQQQQQQSGSQKSSVGAQKPSTAPLKPAAATEKPASAQGPRVLEPAAPPPSDTAKYRRREIRSNWERYEEPADDTPQPDEDFLRGDAFADLLAVSATGAGHFHLKSERSWLESDGAPSELLTLAVDRVAAALCRLPLHQRLGIDPQHFTEEELAVFTQKAETCSAVLSAEQQKTEPIGHDTTRSPVTDACDRVNGGHPVSDAADAAPSASPVLPPHGDGTAPPASGLSCAADTGTDSSASSSSASVPPAPSSSDVSVPPAPSSSDASVPPAPGSSDVGTRAAAAPPPVSGGLLQDDWLDSVLSDDD